MAIMKKKLLESSMKNNSKKKNKINYTNFRMEKIMKEKVDEVKSFWWFV